VKVSAPGVSDDLLWLPYVVAADVYSLESQLGRGGWTWYTGSAGWMYRVWLRKCSVSSSVATASQLSLPYLKSGPDTCSPSAMAEIEVQNGGESSQKEIPLEDDRKSHTIRISTGRRLSPKMPDTSSTPSVSCS
jgi:hypothetical protein